MDRDTSLTEGVEPIAILEGTAAATAAATPLPGVNGSAGAAAGGERMRQARPANTHGRHIAISSPSSRVASSSSSSVTSAPGSPASMPGTPAFPASLGSLGFLGSPSSMTPRTRARHVDVSGLLQRLQAKAENTHSTLLSHRRSIELHEKTIENHESLHAELTGARLQTALRMIGEQRTGSATPSRCGTAGVSPSTPPRCTKPVAGAPIFTRLRPRSSRSSSSESLAAEVAGVWCCIAWLQLYNGWL